MHLGQSPSGFRRKFFGHREYGAAPGSSFWWSTHSALHKQGEGLDQKHLARKECVRHNIFCAYMHPKLMIVHNLAKQS